MKSETPLDYAAFQLSPKRSRCELFVSSNGNTEKLASGLVKPFVSHLKVAEEQVASAVQSIKLEVERHKNAESWFTKGTLERFVRFVSTPEVLELVSTLDVEMSQLEAARRIYSQGASEQLSGGSRSSSAAGADATKKELLRAIDVRLTALTQDLATAYARAAAAGFNHDTVPDLQLFAETFGASRLNEACSKFVSLYDRRPELFNNPSSWKSAVGDQPVRSSYGSDMSIDDDPPTTTTTQQPKSLSSSASFPLRRSTPTSREPSVEKDDTDKDKKEEGGGSGGGAAADEPLAQTAPQPASRRLSVQDRINLFESKQKEVGGSGGSGGKPAVAKPELRRLSSDISHAPAVLRRWSGASDMSIDLSFDKKDTESPLCTPSSSSSIPKTEDRKPSTNSTHAPTSAKTEDRQDQPDSKGQVSGGFGKSDQVLTTKVGTSTGIQMTISSSVKSEESVGSNQLTSTLDKTQSLSSLSKSEDDSLEVPVKPHNANTKSFHAGKEERFGVANQIKFKPSIVETSDQGTDASSIEASDPKPTLRAPSKKISPDSGHQESGPGSKLQEAFAASQKRGLEINSLRSQSRWNSSKETEGVEKDSASSKKQFGESGIQEMKFQKQVRRDESSYVYGYSNTPPSGKFVREESGLMPMEAPLEQSQRARQLKGNQELNDELKMKANELEKLFAEHKLRVPGDQPNSVRRSKPSEVDADPAMSLPQEKLVEDPVLSQIPEQKTAFESPVTEMVEVQIYSDALQRSFSEIGFSDDSRGKFYDSYMKKRDARLRELWGSNRAEKEARMKAVHDSLERNSAELKAKLSWSADRQDSASSARRRAERLRSFNTRSSITREQPLDFGQLEDDEDLSEFSDLKPFGNGVSRNVQGKKPLRIKSSSTSTPRTPAAPVPRSATKVASGSGRRRMQSDNPLAQSVPNFSDLRKENTKPYSAASKAAARSQLRNYTRSRSTNEEMPSVKEEKPRRSQSLRKNSPTPPESSESVILTPLKFDKEENEGVYMKFSKDVETKPSLRKNNGIGPGAGSGGVKMKASMASEAVNKEEYDKLAFELDAIKDDEDEEYDTMKTDDQAVVDGVDSRISQESERLMNSESENGDASQSFSHVDPALVADLPAAATSTFPVQDSPLESPMSWNSRTQHPFSYTHEASDIDASADSPMGSPASWNLQALNPTEADADAARMRKKWGSAQKPILVANSSGVQSRNKDMTKGFKRLLKFGRKSRGTDSLADWISATTSEGDDDTEDGRDPANRSSEDLRKSRMGYSHGLPSEDSFNESDFFSDQVHTLQTSIPAPPANFRLREDHLSGSSIKAPRSFFSLSSFRSKGSDSKPR